MIDTSKETRGFTIKVLNYGKYQDKQNQWGDTEEIDRRYRGDTEVDTIDKEEKNKRIKEHIGEIENLIWRWNAVKRIWKVKWLTTCRWVTKDIEQEYKKFRKKYNPDDFAESVKNYIRDIQTRDENDSYSQHRFSFYEYIKQRNGFTRFYNQ